VVIDRAYLSCNLIRNLSENSFKGLSSIKELNLSKNELEDIVKLATKDLIFFNRLEFSNNNQLNWSID
jgi:Leucine-rich repeat (LRR) protein